MMPVSFFSLLFRFYVMLCYLFRYYKFVKNYFIIIIFFHKKNILIFSCSGMFQNVSVFRILSMPGFGRRYLTKRRANIHAVLQKQTRKSNENRLM